MTAPDYNVSTLKSGLVALTALAIAVFAGGSVHTATKAGAKKKAPAAKSAAKKAAKPAPAKAPAKTRTIPLPGTALGVPPFGLAPDPMFKDASLVVDFSSNWQGYLEPCG